MQFIDFFDRIYIINLPERTDRLKQTIVELKKVGVEIDDGKVIVFPAIKPSDPQDFPSIAVRGCFESHLSVLKLVQEQNFKNVLIIEDDILFVKNFKLLEETIVEQLYNKNWGFVYFGHVEDSNNNDSFILEKYSKPVLTTAFYAVNSNIFNSLISFLEIVKKRPNGHPLGGPMHVDGAYSTFRQQNPDVETWIVFPSLAKQRSSASDISPEWYDQGLFRIVVDCYRALKNLMKY
jgi:GR25 family glycosyltransferase involved in LPS biosynthesis